MVDSWEVPKGSLNVVSETEWLAVLALVWIADKRLWINYTFFFKHEGPMHLGVHGMLWNLQLYNYNFLGEMNQDTKITSVISFEIQITIVIPNCMLKFEGRLVRLPLLKKIHSGEKKSDHLGTSGLKSHSSWEKSLHLTFFLWVVPWVIWEWCQLFPSAECCKHLMLRCQTHFDKVFHWCQFSWGCAVCICVWISSAAQTPGVHTVWMKHDRGMSAKLFSRVSTWISFLSAPVWLRACTGQDTMKGYT